MTGADQLEATRVAHHTAMYRGIRPSHNNFAIDGMVVARCLIEGDYIRLPKGYPG
jgi:hypothetical protein